MFLCFSRHERDAPRLSSAFSFAHFHFEGDAFSAEIFIFLRVAGCNGGKFLEQIFNRSMTNAVYKSAKDFIRLMVFAVELNHLSGGFRDTPSGNLRRRFSEFCDALFCITTQEHHVMRDLMAVHYFRGAVEADVSDMVLTGGIKAAGDLDLNILYVFGR